MKKSIIFVIYGVLLVSFTALNAANTHSLSINSGAKSYFNVLEIKGDEYIDLQTMSIRFFPGSKFDLKKFTLHFKNKTLIFAPSSVFIGLGGYDSTKSFQMRRPSVYINNRLFIPFNSFLIALEVFEIYKVNQTENLIVLNELKNETNAVTNALIFMDENIEPAEDKVESVSEDNQIRGFIPFRREIVLKDTNNGIVQVQQEPLSDTLVTKETFDELDKIINQLYANPVPQEKYKSEKTKIDNIENIKPDKANIDLKIKTNDNNNPDFIPNMYVLPPNLKITGFPKEEIREPIPIADKNGKSNVILSEKANYEVKVELIKIYAEQKTNCTEIHLYANTIIEDYQKPDCDGKTMIIRIPYATDKIKDYSMTQGIYPITKIETDKVRHFQIYKIQMSSEIKQCTSRRNGPKEIIYTVYPNTDKEVVKQEIIKPEFKPDKPFNEIKNNENEVQDNTAVNLDNVKQKWNLDCIVLDPGHGGKDIGAVGVSGVYEKDITLKLARKVKEILNEEMPGTKVVMTRSDDRFIELYKRGQIANQAEGKLFISIHLNSTPKKPSNATGIETYILRPGRNDDAIRVANFENSVINFEQHQDKYKKLNDEEVIIATMAQSAFVKFSELLARTVQEEVGKTTGFEDRGVKQAGFYVLIGASMPNFLFESAFLSNKNDESFANSEEGQEKISRGIVNAIKRYAEEYRKY